MVTAVPIVLDRERAQLPPSLATRLYGRYRVNFDLTAVLTQRMKFYSAKANPHFIGRAAYWQRLTDIDARKEAAIIVIYSSNHMMKLEPFGWPRSRPF